MRTALIVLLLPALIGGMARAQEPSPVEWFLDEYPIPRVAGTGIRKVLFFDNMVPDTDPGLLASSTRRFVLRKGAPPVVEMTFDSLGRLTEAVRSRPDRSDSDTIETIWRQVYDEQGRMVCRTVRTLSLRGRSGSGPDSTLYSYDKRGRMATLRIPHRPYAVATDDVRYYTNKLSTFVYDKHGRLSSLLKQCDPSNGEPSGLLIHCARDTFIYDGEDRLAEIQALYQRYWEPVRHFLYDGAGRLRETAVYAAQNPFLYIRWTYDARDRPVECVHESADGFLAPRVMRFEYGNEGILRRFVVLQGADRVLTDLLVETE